MRSSLLCRRIHIVVELSEWPGYERNSSKCNSGCNTEADKCGEQRPNSGEPGDASRPDYHLLHSCRAADHSSSPGHNSSAQHQTTLGNRCPRVPISPVVG